METYSAYSAQVPLTAETIKGIAKKLEAQKYMAPKMFMSKDMFQSIVDWGLTDEEKEERRIANKTW